VPVLTPTELFLIALLLIFALPYACWRLLRTDHYAPLVVVQIGFGILLGPGILGHFSPALYSGLFTQSVIASLNAIAIWSVMLFVCCAGIELDLKQAWQARRDTAVTAFFALLLPLIFGALVAFAMLRYPGWQGAHGSAWQFAGGVGMACAVTALPILVLFLKKLGILHEPLGQRVLRYASLDDLAIWAVLALILLDYQRLGRQAVVLGLFIAIAPLFRMLMRALPQRDRWPVAVVFLLICSLATDWCGLHFMVGAFLAGVVMDAEWFGSEALDTLRENLLLFLMPVFFLNTGLRTQWSVNAELGVGAIFLAALALLLAAVIGKLLGVMIAGKILRWPQGESRLVGWLLQTKALIMIIFANILLDRAIISAASFTALLLMALMSTMLTIPMVSSKIRALKR